MRVITYEELSGHEDTHTHMRHSCMSCTLSVQYHTYTQSYWVSNITHTHTHTHTYIFYPSSYLMTDTEPTPAPAGPLGLKGDGVISDGSSPRNFASSTPKERANFRNFFFSALTFTRFSLDLAIFLSFASVNTDFSSLFSAEGICLAL